MNSLHPRIIIIWRFVGLLLALALSLGVGSVELWALGPSDIELGAPGVMTGAVAAIAITVALGWPVLRYRAWAWALRPDRVYIQKGVLWRSRTLVPRVRIQHVDTQSSPLQRWLGLSTLVLYTAGTRGADVSIPGLAIDRAEGLREELSRLEELETGV